MWPNDAAEQTAKEPAPYHPRPGTLLAGPGGASGNAVRGSELNITIAVEALEKLVNANELAVGELEERLYPILNERPEKDSLAQEVPPTPKLIDQIVHLAGRLQTLEGRLRSIKGRVQL